MSIRTVQTDFTSSTWSPAPVLHPISMNAQHTMQPRSEKYPPGLGYSVPAAAESSPSLVPSAERPVTTRRRSGGFTYPSGQTYHSGPGVSGGFPPIPPNPSRRRIPQQPQQRRQLLPVSMPTNPSSIKFDPFALDEPSTDEPVYNHYWQYNSTTKSPMLVYKTKPATKASPAPSNKPYTIKLPTSSTVSLPATMHIQSPPLPKPDRNARAKLVAGILLNRIYAVGKPMRRRFSNMTGDKTYVKSGLSSVISVECC